MKRKFDQAIASLNAEQKRAVSTTEGPVMVVAGPGTGKTHVLTLRIAHILDQGLANPSNILALTFTDAAAQNMRDRLIGMIDIAGYSVQIQTFHSFCNSVISQNPEYFTFDDKSTVVSELEQLQLIREILHEDASLRVIKPIGKFDRNTKAVKNAISEAKREGVTARLYQKLVEAQWIDPETDIEALNKAEKEATLKAIKSQAKLKEIARVFEQYESRLSAAGRFDYDDLIMSVIDAFAHNDDLLLEYQESLQYILVDEYQDTNTAQNKVVELLVSHWGQAANVFVVGDPHQSIFRFQGASLYNSATFMEQYPEATVITLVQGYRCPPDIYSLAHNSITKSDFLTKGSKLDTKLLDALNTALVSPKPRRPDSISYHRMDSRESQFAAIARSIQKLIKDGTPPSEIAILFKKNSDSDLIASYLSLLQIPFVSAAEGDALASPIVIQLLDYMTLLYAAGRGDEIEDLTLKVLSFPWLKNDPLLLFKIGRRAGKHNENVWDLITGLTHWENDVPLSESERDAFSQLQTQQSMLMRLAVLEPTSTIGDWLRQVIQDSGLAAFVFDKDRMKQHTADVIALQSFMSFVQRSSDTALRPWRLVDLLRAVQTMNSQELKIPLPTQLSARAITLSTVHKAKGMEWDQVFVIDLNDKKWGNSSANVGQLPAPIALVSKLRLGEASETTQERQRQRDDDDRRLFYVAITRARDQLHLYSYKAETKFGRAKSFSESMFVSEAKLLSIEVADEAQPQAGPHANPQPDELIQRATIIGSRDTDSEGKLEQYISSLIERFRLTVTGLNSYLRDPHEFLMGTLIRIPRPKGESQELGTAMHVLLQKWTQPGIVRNDVSVQEGLSKDVREAVGLSLRHHPLQDRWSQKAYDVSNAYMKMTDHELYDLVIEREYSIGSGGRSALLGDIMLSGKLDRIDWATPDKKEITVTDYKTGAPKTKGEILATADSGRKYMSQREFSLPAEIQGDYYRQLLFYKLLGDLDGSLTAPIAVGVLDFVEEPFLKGKLRREQFSLPNDHVELLKDVIRQVMQEIRSLSFLEVALAEQKNLLPEATQGE